MLHEYTRFRPSGPRIFGRSVRPTTKDRLDFRPLTPTRILLRGGIRTDLK